MIIIEELRKKQGRLIELWADGAAVATMRSTDVYKNGISVGTAIDEGRLCELARQSMFKKAQNSAAYMLSMRDYSKKNLIKKVSRSAGEEAAQAAAEELEEKGYINDARNAERWAYNMLFEKLWSARRTVYELSLKGIERELAENAVEKLCPNEDEQLDRLIAKKYAGRLGDDASRQKAFAAMCRMGYGAGAVKRALLRAESDSDFGYD